MADASIQFTPAELARDTVECLYAEHGKPRAGIYWLILGFAAVSLGSLPFIMVDVSVHAAGMIRPAIERTEVRPAVSGHIAEVLARDNDRVEAGQSLLVLASRDLDERLARNRALQAGHAELIFDLKILSAEIAEPRTDGRASPSPASVRAMAGFKTAALHREHAQLLAQLDSNHVDETRARTEHERYATLAARGIASRSELDRARYDVERLQAEAGLIIQQSLARWQLRLRDEETALDDLASEETRLREEQTHFTIHAPVEGRLIGFNGWSVGGFIANGQSLGAVSPGGALLVETLVSSRDIGLVAVGQAANIQVDAYPYTQWGLIGGRVVSISGDAVGPAGLNAATPPAFKVIIRPDAAELRLPNGVRGDLKKGLTVQARFLVARRSLLQILYDDASSWLDPHGPPRAIPATARG